MKKKNEIIFLKDLKSEMNAFGFLFLPHPSLTSQARILKLKKTTYGVFSLYFPLGWREQSPRNHDVSLELATALAGCHVLLYELEGILSRFSEARRQEGIIPFPTPKYRT